MPTSRAWMVFMVGSLQFVGSACSEEPPTTGRGIWPDDLLSTGAFGSRLARLTVHPQLRSHERRMSGQSRGLRDLFERSSNHQDVVIKASHCVPQSDGVQHKSRQ